MTALAAHKASRRELARSGAATISGLLAAVAVGMVLPHTMWFAIGAGAGYSLSGSV